ncbi:MAG: dienelactone hydrolase family protein [Caulobacter sp.]|nr:dienelactone hydrolase family protein [Caulobacter sp.]
MCDDDIHPGLIVNPAVSRRTFGLMTVAAAGAAGSARAAVPVVEKEVDVKTADGVADAALYYPEGKGKWPTVLIWTDVVGLRQAFRDMGRRLAGEGYVVLVPNVYYRVRRSPVIDGSFDFSKPDDRAKLVPLRASLTPEGVDRDAIAYLAFLDGQPQTNTKRKAGVQGYCMGGPLSVRTAAAVPDRIAAVGSFHGGGLVTDQPTSPHLLLPKTKAEYLIAVADNDDRQDPTVKDKLGAAMTAAGRPHKIEVYTGASHGWCVPGSAVYNEAAAEKAWSALLAMYRRAL